MKVTKTQHGVMWRMVVIIMAYSFIPAFGVAFSGAGNTLGIHPVLVWCLIQFAPALMWITGYFLYLATMPEE